MSVEKIERRPTDEGRLKQLRELFPEVMSDGRVNLDRLRELLGETPDDEEPDEHYGLTWPGRSRARKLASQPPKCTLRPMPGEGVDEDTTQNLLIVGDNLQVLQTLQKSYAGAVKLVYIDPPYNTGTDFIYKDSFAVDEDLYLQETRQADLHGRIVSNPASGGRFHAKWLTFIYPRLAAAHGLLREDGFLVVSIDDAEQANLRLVLDSLFGPENFIATLVWDRNRKNDAKFFSVGHEYMLVYAKNKGRLVEDETILRAPKEGVEEVRLLFEKLRKEYADDWVKVREGLKAFYASIPEDDPRRALTRYTKVDARGPHRTDGDLSWPGGGGPRFQVLHPVTGRPVKIPSRGWVFPTAARFAEDVAVGRVQFGPDESTVPSGRRDLFTSATQVLPTVQYSYAQSAAQRFDAIFDGHRVFDNPKPFEDLTSLVQYLTGPDDVVLDFFAGSGSTGHGVWLANHKHGGHRQFVLVQLDAEVNPDVESGKNAAAMGFPTIDRVTSERLRRVSRQLRSEGATGDLGFRVLRESAPALVRPPIEVDMVKRQQSLAFVPRAAHKPSDLYPEVLLLLGYPLDSAQERVGELAPNNVQRFTHARVLAPLLVCLDQDIEEGLVIELLAILPSEKLPLNARWTFVCRDEALTDRVKLRLADLPITLNVL